MAKTKNEELAGVGSDLPVLDAPVPSSNGRQAFEKWHEARLLQAGQESSKSEAELKFGWQLAAVRAHTKWGQGKEVTEAEFQAALDEVLGIKVGGGGPPQTPPKR